MLLKKLGTDGITMIHKIAGKDGREMQILASLTRQTVNPMAQLRSQRLDGSCLLFARTLYKTRYLLEGDTLLPGERLHRIKHTVMAGHTLENIYGNRTCGMKEQLVFPAPAKLRNKHWKRIVLHGKYIDISIGSHLGNIGDSSPACNRCQSLSRLHHPTINL